MNTDLKVIKQFVKGRKKAFDQIYNQYAPWLLAVAMRYVKDKSTAEDILHDAFIKIYLNRSSFDLEQDIKPWMKTIVIRTALNHIKLHSKLTLNDLNEQESFSEDFEATNYESQSLQKEQLLSALNQLPEGYRIVFTLFAIDNLTHKEIAQYLSISEGTSKSQYHKAKKMIQKHLETSLYVERA